MTPQPDRRSISILIADDSPIFVEGLRWLLSSDANIEVVGVAGDGLQAVELANTLRPDLVVMDVHMPKMGGLEAVSAIMQTCPTPILVVTSEPAADRGGLCFEALRRGALDLRIKPTGLTSSSVERQELQQHLHVLARMSVARRAPPPMLAAETETPPGAPSVVKRAGVQTPKGVVGIVASTGGPVALAQIVSELPADFPACVLIVQHVGADFTRHLVTWLDRQTPMPVRIARDSEPLHPATVLVAPDDRHLGVSRTARVILSDAPAENGHRPSGNVLLGSLADNYGTNAIGLILSGMGADGVDGLLCLRRAGGTTLAQDETTSVVFGMPGEALRSEATSTALALNEIAPTLLRLTCGGTP